MMEKRYTSGLDFLSLPLGKVYKWIFPNNMARSFLCIKCNLEFPNDTIYLAHKQSGHTSHLDKAARLDEPPTPIPPPGVPKEALPSPEFMEQIQRIEAEKQKALSEQEKPVESNSRPSQHPSELPAASPVMLTYRY